MISILRPSQSNKSKAFLILFFAAIFLSINLLIQERPSQITNSSLPWWEVQSIDTMKYSRDLARQKLNDDEFNQAIEEQVSKISQIGATHVSVATPYDKEFLAFLKSWVAAARKHHLNVWFRGNWSGWEGWFDYPAITREEHLRKTKQFILENKDLFGDGDIFTPCPECENGGPGDPRHNNDVSGHRAFLIKEYQITTEVFEKIGKEVRSNFNSMNGDVAKLIMDEETTKAMGGIVTIDHYVPSVKQLVRDIGNLASQSKGQVVLGEFGVPIIDIHGAISEQEQADWIAEALNEVAKMPEVIGLNYWVNAAGPTGLWNEDRTPRQSVVVIRSFFIPQVASGVVKNELGRPIAQASVESGQKSCLTDRQGKFQFPYHLVSPARLAAKRAGGSSDLHLVVSADGFTSQELNISDPSETIKVVLTRETEGIFWKIGKFLRRFFDIV